MINMRGKDEKNFSLQLQSKFSKLLKHLVIPFWVNWSTRSELFTSEMLSYSQYGQGLPDLELEAGIFDLWGDTKSENNEDT